MSVAANLAKARAEPDIIHARARLVIDRWGAPVGMLLWPMDDDATPLTLNFVAPASFSGAGIAPGNPSKPKRVVLKPQIVIARERGGGQVKGYIWRVDSGDLEVLMGQDTRIFQSLARYFGPPGEGGEG